AAVEWAAGHIADRLDRGGAVDAAAVEPGPRAGPPIRIAALASLLEFQVRDLAVDDEAADAADGGIALQELERVAEKVRVEAHIAVDQAEIAAVAVLIAELCADAPGG